MILKKKEQNVFFLIDFKWLEIDEVILFLEGICVFGGGGIVPLDSRFLDLLYFLHSFVINMS